jgi:spore cortex formation protein SpoVR/YcgB (stage V sporulation)
MPIVHSDRISGIIHVIADSAESAGNKAIEHLLDKDDAIKSYGVFDHRKDADQELHNRYNSYGPDRDRVCAISLDIRIADEK